MTTLACSRMETFAVNDIQISVTSSDKVFNTTDDLVKKVLSEELSERFKKTGKQIAIGDTGTMIRIDFNSISTQFNAHARGFNPPPLGGAFRLPSGDT